ncbi:MAG: V-type ATPase 116kDa subunit family protein [Arenicellales bacterium]
MAWVDLLVDRGSVPEALHRLGEHRLIELRPYDRREPLFQVAADEGLLERLIRVRERLQRYAAYLPAPAAPAWAGPSMQSTEDVLPQLERTAEAWLGEARPVIRKLEATLTRLERYRLLGRCLAALPDHAAELQYFVRPTHPRAARYVPVVALGKADDRDLFAAGSEDARFEAYPLPGDPERTVFIGFIDREALAELERLGHARGVDFAAVPEGLAGDPREATRRLEAMVEAETRRESELRSELNAIAAAQRMAECLGLLHRQVWIQEALSDALSGTRFVWLGGWVQLRRYSMLVRVLEDAGLPFLVNHDVAGDHGEPPVELANPRWVRRFEVFARGFGMPSPNEVDPSPLLAVVTPLMFGYMFGDVGQGLVVAGAAWLLRDRFPILSLLVPAGLVAAGFGLLFGSLFCNERVLPALWLHPMEEPMTLLLIPVAFGFLFTLTGIALSGVEARWGGTAGPWWRRTFPLMMMYTAAALAVRYADAALALGLSGLAVYTICLASEQYRRGGLAGAAGHLVGSLLELLETLVQLLINTVSFARLGAFALAHAGLASAVVTLAAIPDSPWVGWLILVLGNVLVIALEGLVVAIQTTRLVMFEFFRRFYTGSGTPFRPLALPETAGAGPM